MHASHSGVQLKASAVTQPSYFYFQWAGAYDGYHTTVIKSNSCIQMQAQSYTVSAHRHTTETTGSSKPSCYLHILFVQQ